MAEPRVDRLTASQRDALAAELAELEGPKRTAIVEAIKTAREHGDLSENFEYHAAKKTNRASWRHAFGHFRDRASTTLVIVEESELAAGQVGIGSTVEARSEPRPADRRRDLDRRRNRRDLSDSPLGRALIGRREGDAVEVEAPRAGPGPARIVVNSAKLNPRSVSRC
jgi:transcription elongation factor GreA